MPLPLRVLAPEAEASDDRSVPLDVVALHIVEQSTPTTDHHEQTTTGVVVVLVSLEVLGEAFDALGEEGDLNLGRAGVGLVESVLCNRCRLVGHAGVSCFLLVSAPELPGPLGAPDGRPAGLNLVQRQARW